MRLWHKDLIPYLPKQQLLGQWRECCLIVRNIAQKGTPNHILVNPIMDYPGVHFDRYCALVIDTMKARGYKVDPSKVNFYFGGRRTMHRIKEIVPIESIFPGWHTPKYLTQCLANLEEKHDRGGIPDDEWNYLLKSIGRKGARE